MGDWQHPFGRNCGFNNGGNSCYSSCLDSQSVTIRHNKVAKQQLKRMFLPPPLLTSHSTVPLVRLFIHQTRCPWLRFVMIVRAARIQCILSGQFTSAFSPVSMRTQDDSEHHAWNVEESLQHYGKTPDSEAANCSVYLRWKSPQTPAVH